MKIDTAALRQALKEFNAAGEIREELSNRVAEVDRDEQRFVENLPKAIPLGQRIGILSLRRSDGAVASLAKLFKADPPRAKLTIASELGNLRQLLAQPGFEGDYPKVAEAGAALVRRLEALIAETEKIEAREKRLETALVGEIRSLRSYIEDFYWAKREGMLDEVRRLILPFCSDEQNAKQTADFCERPRDIFRKAARFSQKYQPVRFETSASQPGRLLIASAPGYSGLIEAERFINDLEQAAEEINQLEE